MGLGETLLLGFIAGATILLGMPIGRLRRPAPALQAFLNAFAVGILLFLVWDVLSHAWDPVDSALGQVHDGHGGVGAAVGYGLLFAAGLAVGLLALVAYDRWMGRRGRPAAGAEDPGVRFGPGAAHVDELRSPRWRSPSRWPAAERLSLLIAVGIGLHNFAEGLAIGQSAARSQIALATLLVIGFALHNATEGFGIVGPLAASRSPGAEVDDRPPWGFLLAMATIGGGPTFVGTLIGHSFTSKAVSVAFLTLAAGSIVYVVIQLLNVAAKSRRPDILAYGLMVGLLLGFGTDAVITVAGA